VLATIVAACDRSWDESYASTDTLYDFPHESPVKVNDVDFVEVVSVPETYTSYRETRELSWGCDHEMPSDVFDVAVTWRFVGADGAVDLKMTLRARPARLIAEACVAHNTVKNASTPRLLEKRRNLAMVSVIGRAPKHLTPRSGYKALGR
jgi:hypothetical protein